MTGRYSWQTDLWGEVTAAIRRYAPTVNDDGDPEFLLDEPETIDEYRVDYYYRHQWLTAPQQRDRIERWARKALADAATAHPTYYVDCWLTRYEYDVDGQQNPAAHASFAVGDKQFEWYKA